MNLAPWKYRNLLSSEASPIERVSIRKVTAQESLFGKPFFEAYAYLRQDLRKDFPLQPQLYGDAEGTGTSQYKQTACYIAISEALERWAFFDLFSKKKTEPSCGFDSEASTAGMAAYPGLTACEVRRISYFEAIERWSLQAWWESKIGISSPVSIENGINGYFILTPFSKVKTVILHAKTKIKQLNSFGFASGFSEKSAVISAKRELDRNARLLDKSILTCKRNSIGDTTKPIDYREKRVLYFSEEEGFSDFKERTRINATAISKEPKTIVNCEVVGPWSCYARVWRQLFLPVTLEHKNESNFKYFYF